MNLFGKIPLTVTPGFWVVAFLVGYLNTNDLVSTLILVGVIFISVLVHELGHASIARRFGLNSKIELIAFGGITHYAGKTLSIFKQFLVVLAGPLFGFALFLVGCFLYRYASSSQSLYFSQFLHFLQGVNLFWTFFNLIPILPLDGGQLLRLVFEKIVGSKALSYTLFFSIVLSVLGAFLFFFFQMILIGSFFFLFAFQSYMDWQRVKNLVFEDPCGELQKRFLEAEFDLRSGNKEKAIEIFQDLIKNPSKGLIVRLSSQYLAFVEYEQGNALKAYEILLPYRKKLTRDGLYLLYKIAFDVGDYSLVIDLSAPCFQSFPVLETALKAAKSHAIKGEVIQCIGWLQASLELGLVLSQELMLESFFLPVKNDKSFSRWLQKHIY